MGMEFSIHEGEENACKVLVGNPKGKGTLGRQM
jgi:hypothetical protein